MGKINQTNKGKICKTPGCTHGARAKGYCNLCYDREYKHRMKLKVQATSN